MFRISKDILNQNHLSFERLNGKQTIVIPLDTSNARALLRICKYHKKDKGSPFTISEEIPVAVAEVVPVERRDVRNLKSGTRTYYWQNCTVTLLPCPTLETREG